ncbi:unnamed protein product [Schistosoma bovis]|nr:unnamed protein product [Schistosoma bovis]
MELEHHGKRGSTGWLFHPTIGLFSIEINQLKMIVVYCNDGLLLVFLFIELMCYDMICDFVHLYDISHDFMLRRFYFFNLTHSMNKMMCMRVFHISFSIPSP